jgi:hypothetical protein
VPTYPPIFCVTGIDGCGKSTHLQLLADRLAATGGGRTAPLSVWEIAHSPRYQVHPFIADRAAVHRYLGTLHRGPRLLFVLHGLLESLELAGEVAPPPNPAAPSLIATPPSLILANGYWHKYVFTEHLHGEDLDWLRLLCRRFPVPRRTVLLDLSPEAAFERKPGITPYECGFQPPGRDTFVAFQARLRTLFLAEAARAGWPVIDADRPQEQVAADLHAIFAE